MSESTFAEVFARAISARGVTLQWLSEVSTARGDPVSVASLSYWRRGQRVPQGEVSMSVVRRMEEILHLGEGELVARVPAHRIPGPDRREDFDHILGRVRLTSNASELAALVDNHPRDMVVTGAHQRFDLGADRRIARGRFQTFLQARIDGARSHLTMWHFDSTPDEVPSIASPEGVRVGACLYDPEYRTFVAELLLPRALRRGETAVFEYTLEGLAERDEVTTQRHVLPRRVNEASLWLRFHPEALPRRCRKVAVLGDDKRRDERVRLVDGALHQIVRGFGPGYIGFEWSWSGTSDDVGSDPTPAR